MFKSFIPSIAPVYTTLLSTVVGIAPVFLDPPSKLFIACFMLHCYNITGKIPDLNNPLFSFVNEIRSSQAMIEMFRTMNESASVNGVIVIYDFTGLRSKYLTRLSVDELKKYSKIFQVSVNSHAA